MKLAARLTCGLAFCLAIAGGHAFGFGDPAPSPLGITLAVIWEGEPVSEVNLEAMRTFRKAFAATRMIHFVSPAYLARGGGERRSAGEQPNAILSAFEKDDIAGIFLNGWRSTVESAGVTFRTTPTFWGNILNPRQCPADCGREVAMTGYSPAELRKIIRKSRELFAKNGFGAATVMQVGGHAAGPEVLGAAAAEGITHDFSAVAAELISSRLFRFPLRQQLRDLWGGVGPLMSPFDLDTGSGKITQMTANGLHLEYMSEGEVRAYLDRMLVKGAKDSLDSKDSKDSRDSRDSKDTKDPRTAANRHLYIGVPAETFAITRPKLELAMREIIQRASDTKTSLKWTAETIPGAGDNKPVLPTPSPTPSPTPASTPAPTPAPTQTPTPTSTPSPAAAAAGQAH